MAKVPDKLHPFLDHLVSMEGIVGFLTFIFSVAFAFGWFWFFSFLAGRQAGAKTKDAFGIMAWSVLPLFAFSSLAQMSEFFFFRYYPMIADGFLDLFGMRTGVRPLAYMNSPWLLLFKVISIAGALWSLLFTWQLSGRLSDSIFVRVKVSAPFWFLHLLILSAFSAHIVVMTLFNMPQVTGPRG